MEATIFLQNLGWGTFGLGSPGFSYPPDAENVIWFGPLRGLQHHELRYVYHHIHPETRLELRRESTNHHDPFACAVYFRSHKIGYVPMSQNNYLAQVLDSGCHLSVRVTKVIKTKYLPTTGLEIEIYNPAQAA